MANKVTVEFAILGNDNLIRNVDQIEKKIVNTDKAVKNLDGQFDLLADHMGPVGAKFQQVSGVITQFGAAFGVAGGVAAGAVAGFAIAATGVALLGKEIFDLTVRTAEFEGKFQDLSQQVGVSVETLSTLEVLASQTGGNIDSATAALGLFQVKLDGARDSTSAEAEMMHELGITTTDTDLALRQALKGLHAMGEGSKQTAASIELFGRSGRFFNAILKESGGDIGQMSTRLNEMGVLITGPMAQAADQFNDNLNMITRQLAAATFQIGNEAIPAFIVFFDTLSTGLTGSQDGWKAWGRFVQIQIAGVLGIAQGLYQFIASRGSLDLFTLIDANIQGILDEVEGRAVEARMKAALAANLPKPAPAPLPGFTPADAQKKLNAELAETKKIQDSIAATYKDTQTFLDDMAQRVDKNNPFVSLFTQADTVMERMQKRFGAFGDEFVGMMAKVENQAIEMEMLAARIQSAQKVLDIQAEIRKLQFGATGVGAEDQRRLGVFGKRIDAARDIPGLEASARAIEQGRLPGQVDAGAILSQQLEEIRSLKTQFSATDAFGKRAAQTKINEALIGLFAGATPQQQAQLLNSGEFRGDLSGAYMGQAQDRRQAIIDEQRRAEAGRFAVEDAQKSLAMAKSGGFENDAARGQFLSKLRGLGETELTPQMRVEGIKALEIEKKKEAEKEKKAEEDRKLLNAVLLAVGKQITSKGFKVDQAGAGVLVEVKNSSSTASVTGPSFASTADEDQARRDMQGL